MSALFHFISGLTRGSLHMCASDVYPTKYTRNLLYITNKDQGIGMIPGTDFERHKRALWTHGHGCGVASLFLLAYHQYTTATTI